MDALRIHLSLDSRGHCKYSLLSAVEVGFFLYLMQTYS